jgi:predicted outer membrane protein
MASKVVWRDNGPWKRTIVHREETPHDFPKPHTDVLEQVIDYRVSAESVGQLALFDGSLVVKRTEGEISARCDMEAMNFLTLNLANEVVLRTKTVAEARSVHAEHVKTFMSGGDLSYTTGLHFVALEEPTSEPDQTIIAGAPQRARADIQLVSGQNGPTDSTILAALIAQNEHAVEQARLVLESTHDDAVRRFAERLKMHHGKGVRDAMRLAARAGITPQETNLVTSMKRDADNGIAELALLQDKDFDKVFIALAVKEHRQFLSRIERSFLPRVSNRDLALELVGVRAVIASHLREARKLQKILEDRSITVPREP